MSTSQARIPGRIIWWAWIVQLFWGFKPFIRQARFLERAAGTVSPVIRAGDEVVDYLRKAKAARLHKHRRVRFFFLSALWLLCRRTALRSVSSLGLGSQMPGGSRCNVSPRLTEIGICAFS